MHILFVCSELPPAPHGGIGVFVKTLAQALLHKGDEVTVAGYDETVDADREGLEDGIKVYRLYDPFIRKNKVLLFKRYYLDVNFYLKRRHLSRAVKKIVRQDNVDLVESYDWSGPLWSHPGVPLIVRMHGANTAYQYLEGKRYGKLLSYLEKRNLKLADKLVGVSRHIGEATLEAFGLNTTFQVIHNPVDMARFSSDAARDINKMIYVGRLHERKGLFELFKALDIVMAHDKDVYVELYGGGGDSVVRKVKEAVPAAIRNRVLFKGYIPHHELPSAYASAGLMLCPSRAEAFGLTAAEAMSCGTPVLMTRETSGPEIIRKGVNGMLTSLSDIPTLAKDLGDMVIQVKQGKFDAQKIRQYASDHFSLEKITSENRAFYQSCLSNL